MLPERLFIAKYDIAKYDIAAHMWLVSVLFHGIVEWDGGRIGSVHIRPFMVYVVCAVYVV